MRPELVIKRPLMLTEKNSNLRDKESKYVFEVDRKACKPEIRDAIEKLFNVKVANVRTSITRGKIKRVGRRFVKLANTKKAIVSLKDGNTIDLYSNA